MSETKNNYKVIDNGYRMDKVSFQGDLNGTGHCYKYQMPAVCVDLIVFSHDGEYVHLVQRGSRTEPKCYRYKWAIPGGFINYNETGENAARREYKEETGLDAPENGIHFLHVADAVDRDPRQRTISLIYWAVAKMNDTDDAVDPVDTMEISGHRWVKLKSIKQLAFDHNEHVQQAYQAYLDSLYSEDTPQGVKRRMSGYNLFYKENHEEIRKTKDQDINLMSAVGAQWKALSPKDQETYNSRAMKK